MKALTIFLGTQTPEVVEIKDESVADIHAATDFMGDNLYSLVMEHASS